MSVTELFILALGLSMDAFAVSVCKGLSLGNIKSRHICLAGIWFGGFQALMPILGYCIGSLLTDVITKYDHWVAFGLLSLIGCDMIKEALFAQNDIDNDAGAGMDVKTMFMLAVATSIDALAVGVTFAFLEVNIAVASAFIGVTTFICSGIGVKAGSIFGMKHKKTAELFGGMALIFIGIKILIQGIIGL